MEILVGDSWKFASSKVGVRKTKIYIKLSVAVSRTQRRSNRKQGIQSKLIY